MEGRCLLEFKPSGKEIEVEAGTVLSDAIELAGLELNLPCGGQGRCGRCKVVVEKGEVKRRSISRLSKAELEQGYALACQTLVESDLSVLILPQELLLRKLPSEREIERIELPVECDWRKRPSIRTFPLELPPPSLSDNVADFERVKRELLRRYGVSGLVSDLPSIKRLSKTLREADWRITATVEMGTWVEESPRLIDVRPLERVGKLFGVAVDIGTTTIVVYLVDLLSGEVVDTASEYNAQISCGEDIISRIIYATKREGGLDHLQRLVIQTINGLLDDLSRRNGIDQAEIYRMTVAGNTTMIHLFLGIWPEPIRLEPYVPVTSHPLPVKASEIGLHMNPEATVDCLPGVASYMGSDITAGVLSSLMFKTEKISLFIDVGTNGEIVLGNNDWLVSCACSAGPAFEGSGVKSGMRATMGAIEEVWIDGRTYEPTYITIGGAPPIGICGSGMISLLAEMFITGVIDKAGMVNLDLPTRRVRVGEHGPEYVVAWKEETGGGKEEIVITEVDIANLIRAKAAIYAGISVLVRSVGLEIADIEQVLIGGAFGKYINLEKAIQIGMLPDMPLERFRFLGNTSALGAYTALVCPDMRSEVAEIAKRMTYLELSADNTFYDEFTKAMFLPHTDIAAFPSVARLLGEGF